MLKNFILFFCRKWRELALAFTDLSWQDHALPDEDFDEFVDRLAGDMATHQLQTIALILDGTI